jgi:hypothetical protein
MPGMRPGGPMPNFMMPMVQQGQQPQRPAGRRAGGMQQPMPMGGQQQVCCIILVIFQFCSLNCGLNLLHCCRCSLEVVVAIAILLDVECLILACTVLVL